MAHTQEGQAYNDLLRFSLVVQVRNWEVRLVGVAELEVAGPMLDLECDLGLRVVEHHGNTRYYLRLPTQQQSQRAVDSWMEGVLAKRGCGHTSTPQHSCAQWRNSLYN